MSLSPDFKQRLMTTVAATPSATQAQTRSARWWLLGAGVMGALMIFFLKGGVRPTGRPAALTALTSLGASISGGLGMFFLLTTRGKSMLRRPAGALLAAAVLSTAAFLAWKMAWSAQFGLTFRWPDRIGFRCLRMGVVVGALPLFALLASYRGTEPLRPATTGAAFGAGAGLASAVLVDLWCPVGYLPHLLLGHVLPIVALAGIGALLGWRLLRIGRR